jgi:integrase
MRLRKFELFLVNEYGQNLDTIIEKLKQQKMNPYEILISFCAHLSPQNLSTLTTKYHVITAKNFLEFNDIEISPRKFKLKVKLPKIVRRNKEALSKEEIIDILNACSNIRLKTYVMFLASTGCRAGEATSIRLKDVQFDRQPATIFLRGEYTKTKNDRVVFLTDELVHQLKSWIEFKYRRRRICSIDKITGIPVSHYRTPNRNEHDLIFASRNLSKVKIMSIYIDLCHMFERTLDRMGKGEREEGNYSRRKITLHSFRRFVKTTISDLGYQDFSEFILGHTGSAYWRKKDSEKAELFRKIEPYLTYLDIQQLERQGADIETKINQLTMLNDSFREWNRMKDDIISSLSDKIVALTERIEVIEKR